MAFNLTAFIGPGASLGSVHFAGAAGSTGSVAMPPGGVYPFERHSSKLRPIDSGFQMLADTPRGGSTGIC